MIKVHCTVNTVDKQIDKHLSVESCDNPRGAVKLVIELPVVLNSGITATHITVFADDLIQAIENCRNNGFRMFPTRYNYNLCKQNEDDEDNE